MYINDRVLDLGLNVLDTEATAIFINSAEPATYTAATSTNALGSKSFGAGAAFGSPAASTSPTGRKVSSTAITDGSVTATGTATHQSAVDATNSRLLVANSLAASQAVTSGNPFQLASYDVKLANS